MKPISQYTPHGVLFKTYPSIKIASEESGLPYNTIREAAKNPVTPSGRPRVCGGFVWVFETDPERIKSLFEEKKAIPHIIGRKKNTIHVSFQVDLDVLKRGGAAVIYAHYDNENLKVETFIQEKE